MRKKVKPTDRSVKVSIAIYKKILALSKNEQRPIRVTIDRAVDFYSKRDAGDWL